MWYRGCKSLWSDDQVLDLLWKEDMVCVDVFAGILAEEHTLLGYCSWTPQSFTHPTSPCAAKQPKSVKSHCPRYRVDSSVHKSKWTKLRGSLSFCEPGASLRLTCTELYRVCLCTQCHAEGLLHWGNAALQTGDKYEVDLEQGGDILRL